MAHLSIFSTQRSVFPPPPPSHAFASAAPITHMPQSELHDLIVELRSLTLGVGSFAHHFDHMQEMTGRPMEKVLAMRTADAAQ